MRLLHVKLQGSPLFAGGGFSFDLFATDRVSRGRGTKEAPIEVAHVGESGSIYSLNVVGLTGVNASGKTTLLNILRFVFGYVSDSYSMRGFMGEGYRLGKLSGDFDVSLTFWHNDAFYLAESHIGHAVDYSRALGSKDARSSDRFVFADETIWRFAGKAPTRSQLSDPEAFKAHAALYMKRNGEPGEACALSEHERGLLGPDRSLVAYCVDGLADAAEFPTRNLPLIDMPVEVVRTFDPSVEKLAWDNENQVFHLKFAGEPERSVSMGIAVQMLSRGTVYGAELVSMAIDALAAGSCMIVDEIEDSLNRSLVEVIIRLFASPVTNPRGAQLVFSTHYPEVLDSLKRKDNVYVLTRGADHLTQVVKYSSRVERVENKKSEVILSNMIKGSMPNYPDVREMRAYVKKRAARQEYVQ